MSDCCSVKAPAVPAAVMSCPECGSRSKKVGAITVKSLIRRLPFGMAPAQYYFCEAPACDVVYFPSNPQAPTFHRGVLPVRVGLKEKHDPVPVCYCFGVARRDIADEIQRTRKIYNSRANQSRGESRQLRLRGQESFGQVLPGRCYPRRAGRSADRRSGRLPLDEHLTACGGENS